MTTLRQRMQQDLQLRNYSPHTVDAYLRCVASFARHFGQSPDELTPEHIRQYQIFLSQERHVSWSLFTQTVSALRFFYETTLGRSWNARQVPYSRGQKRLPTVLSPAEVLALLAAAPNVRSHVLLATLYATGLRVSELVQLQLADLDSSRQLIRIRQGKGQRDRFVMLSPKLLLLLRQYWKRYHPRHWLFPGEDPQRPVTPATVQRLCHDAAQRAHLDKVVTPHVLRKASAYYTTFQTCSF